jgi:hypothetical protein
LSGAAAVEVARPAVREGKKPAAGQERLVKPLVFLGALSPLLWLIGRGVFGRLGRTRWPRS